MHRRLTAQTAQRQLQPGTCAAHPDEVTVTGLTQHAATNPTNRTNAEDLSVDTLNLASIKTTALFDFHAPRRYDREAVRDMEPSMVKTNPHTPAHHYLHTQLVHGAFTTCLNRNPSFVSNRASSPLESLRHSKQWCGRDHFHSPTRAITLICSQ